MTYTVEDALKSERQRDRARSLRIPWEAVEAARVNFDGDNEQAIDYIMRNYRFSDRESLASVIRANNRVRRARAEREDID